MDFFELELKINTDYTERLNRYNEQVRQLEQERKKFYEDNPDFPYKTMFMQVTAPPQKLTIKYIT